MTKILVVLDPEETRHSALNRIKEIPVDNAEFKVEYYLQGPATAKQGSQYTQDFRDKNRWLAELVKPYREMGYKIETQVQCFSRLYETILESAFAYEADYILKPLRQHALLKRMLFTSTDWNLIRFCECPLLLVSHANSIKGHPVIAAVDLASQDSAHEKLNAIVVEQSKALADILNSDVHLVNAYNVASVHSANMAGDALSCQLVQGRRKEQFKIAHDLSSRSNIASEHTHLAEGTAEQVVNQCAVEIGAGVIVVGTMARYGFSGLFIGNTAEAVIEQTQCDVFVVKQADFESPVRSIEPALPIWNR